MNKSGIYCIKNIINGKLYVGSAVCILKRKQDHIWALRGGIHKNIKLQNAWNKYGADSFVFEVLETIIDKSLLIKREQFWMDLLGSATRAGYNIAQRAGSSLGIKHSEETRAKLALISSGVKQTPETIEKRVAQFRGKKKTDECKQKISAAHKGKILTEEHRLKLSIAHKGLKYPNRNMNGYKHPPETIAKMAAGHKGFKHSPESIAKMRGSKKRRGRMQNGRPLTIEQLKAA